MFRFVKNISEALNYAFGITASNNTSSDFVKEIRMNRAADLLSDTSLSIGEIAHRLGYKNQGKFSSAFKQRQGIGPFEYRKRIKKIFCED